MTHAFAGTLLLPGEDGDGLAAVLQAAPEDVRLSAGDEELGTWSISDCEIEPVGKGAFSVTLGGEIVLFTPETPAQFAEILTVPLQPEREEMEKKTASENKEEKLRAKHMAKVAKAKKAAIEAKPEKEVLGKGLTFMIVAMSTVLMATLLVISLTI
jgi:hypothetical protein